MIKGSAKNIFVSTVILALHLAQAQPAVGQTEAAADHTGAAEQLKEARGFFALPLELDFDSGAANGDANILRIMPLYTFPVLEKWKLVNLSIITLADAPGGIPAFPGDPGVDQSAGVSDLIHASFVTPHHSGDFIWGIGAMLALPTATDDSLGSGKWAAGPAVRVTYRKGPWNCTHVHECHTCGYVYQVDSSG